MNKKSILAILLVFCFVFGVMVVSGKAAHAVNALIVPSTENPDIQTAVNNASNGDTIMVMPGTYKGAYITKRLNIIGSDGAIINEGVDANGRDFFCAFVVRGAVNHAADGTSIKNFTINCNENNKGGIYFVGADNITLSDLTINNGSQCITDWMGSGWNITHNKITGLKSNGSFPWTFADSGLTCYYPTNLVGLDQMGVVIIGTTSWDDYTNPNQVVENNLIAFNEIDGTNPIEGYIPASRIGIILEAFGDAPMINNKAVNNKISISPVAAVFNGAFSLTDYSPLFGGSVILKNNQILGLNKFNIVGSSNIPPVLLYPGNFCDIEPNPYPDGPCSNVCYTPQEGYPNLAEYNTFNPSLSFPPHPAQAKGKGPVNKLLKKLIL